MKGWDPTNGGTTCVECGNLIDNPAHVLGCRAGRYEVNAFPNRPTPLERLTDALDAIADETHGALTLGSVTPECTVVAAMCDGDQFTSVRRVAQRVWLLERNRQSLLVEIAAVEKALRDEGVPSMADGLPIAHFGQIRWLGDQRRISERRFDALDAEVAHLR